MKQMSTNCRSIFAFVRLNDYSCPLIFCFFFSTFELSHSVITNFVFLTRIFFFPLNPFIEGVLACLRLCECEYFFINLMLCFASTCKSVCARLSEHESDDECENVNV